MVKRKILMTLVILITMILGMMTVNVKAVEMDYTVTRYDWSDGHQISAGSTGDGAPVFWVKIGGVNYRGTCIQATKDVDYSACVANITDISNGSKNAKIDYH